MEEKRQKLEDFHPQIEKETVFRLIHCYPDSPVYEDMEDSFQEMQEEMLRLCHPVGENSCRLGSPERGKGAGSDFCSCHCGTGNQ